MSVFVFIILVCGVVWLLKTMNQRLALHQAAQDAFKADHQGWDIYFAPYGKAVIALNHDSHSLVLGNVEVHHQYPWSAIASVDVVRDGTSITSTNRGSQLMGAAVGEVLLGPLGLLIGGVTGSKRTVHRISQIGLKIIVDDRRSPVFTIDFLRVPGSGADPRHKLVKEAARRTEHVHALLVNAIRKTSREAASPTSQVANRSVADRIDQLWKLKEVGALTEAEFDQQKAQVLTGLTDTSAGGR